MTERTFQAVVEDDGTVRLPPMPDRSGEAVEIVVRPRPLSAGDTRRGPRRSPEITGNLDRYTDPFGPAGNTDDWDAA